MEQLLAVKYKRFMRTYCAPSKCTIPVLLISLRARGSNTRRFSEENITAMRVFHTHVLCNIHKIHIAIKVTLCQFGRFISRPFARVKYLMNCGILLAFMFNPFQRY